MAFYTVSYSRGLLTEAQQARMAQVITTVHTQLIPLENPLSIRVLFMESSGPGFVAGQPSPCVLVRVVYKCPGFVNILYRGIWTALSEVAKESRQTWKMTLTATWARTPVNRGGYIDGFVDEDNVFVVPPDVSCTIL